MRGHGWSVREMLGPDDHNAGRDRDTVVDGCAVWVAAVQQTLRGRRFDAEDIKEPDTPVPRQHGGGDRRCGCHGDASAKSPRQRDHHTDDHSSGAENLESSEEIDIEEEGECAAGDRRYPRGFRWLG
jgi:hypothetical protein